MYITPETSHISNMPHTINNNVSNNNYIMIFHTKEKQLSRRYKFVTPLSYFRRICEFLPRCSLKCACFLTCRPYVQNSHQDTVKDLEEEA
jgi:hypothetical protein